MTRIDENRRCAWSDRSPRGRRAAVGIGLLFGAGLLVAAPHRRAEGAPSARDIVQRAIDNQIFNLRGAEMQIAMLLTDSRGDSRERKLSARTAKRDGLSRTLSRFTDPPDVAGTAFLFLENKGREDDQFMYLPALKVVRRIAGSQKNASFMGSDLTYADLESRDLDEATHRSLPDEKIGVVECYVVEAIPKNTESYSRVRTWIRKKDFVALRTQFFDLQGKLLKVLFVKEVQRVGSAWAGTKIRIKNEQSGHSTFITVTGLREVTSFTDQEFTVRALKNE